MKETPQVLMIKWQNSSLAFVKDIWNLTPQPLKPEYREKALSAEEYKAEMFGEFIKGEHISWQQFVLFEAIDQGIHKFASRKIAVESGVGTGKTAALAMLIIWFLFTHIDAVVPCTAPTAPQMDDALWKELKLWLTRMPPRLQELFEWSSGYLRVKQRRETWFARARTASKDKPEALAGIHSDDVLLIADEASGIDDEVFRIGQGVFAGENVYAILISQHQRLIGYFHNCFNSNKQFWQTFRFNAEESPLSDNQLRDNIVHEYGDESDEYRVQILGMPPHSETVDDKGYVPLLNQADLKFSPDIQFIGRVRLGIDPAGEGTNETVWVCRDRFKSKRVASEKTSTAKGIAQKTLTLAKHFGVNPMDTYVDNFGVGANVAVELALADFRVNAVNSGDKPEDDVRFLNRRAEIAWRAKDWLRSGGELVQDEAWQEALNIRYHANLKGKIAIMSKDLMRREGIQSPDTWDAFALTFWDKDNWDSKFRSHNTMEEEDDVGAVL